MRKLIFILLILFILPAHAQYTGVKPMLGAPIDRSHSLARGLVGCWLMNEGSGNTVYDIIGGNHGEFFGNVNFVPGHYGPAIENDGAVGSYISCGDHCNFGDASTDRPFSIVASFYSHNSATSQPIVSRYYDTGSDGAEYSCIINPDSKLFFQCLDDNHVIRIKITGSQTIALNTWYHVVFTYDGSSSLNGLFIYVNGIVDGSAAKATDGSYGAMHDKGVDLEIGSVLRGNESYDSFFDGLLDNVMIYNRALNASEVQQLYYDPFGMFERSPVEMYVSAGEAPSGGGQVIFIMSSVGWPLLMIILITLTFYWIGGRDDRSTTL